MSTREDGALSESQNASTGFNKSVLTVPVINNVSDSELDMSVTHAGGGEKKASFRTTQSFIRIGILYGIDPKAHVTLTSDRDARL